MRNREPRYLTCPLCGGPSMDRFQEMFDDRFGCAGFVTIARCSACTHHFVSTPLDADSIRDLYENFYGRTANTELRSHRTLTCAGFRWIMGEGNLGQYAITRKGARVLDVGSGDCQNVWDTEFLGHSAIGFDVDRTSELIGRKYGLDIRTGSKLDETLLHERFDWIQLNQVLEHYVDPRHELGVISKLLAPEGRIFISTPNSSSIFAKVFRRRWINWHVPYHRHHFTGESLGRLLESQGWLVEKRWTTTPLIWTILQVRRLAIQPQNGVVTTHWGSSQSRIRNLIELGLSSIFLPLIRLIDVIGFGDSIVIIAKRKP